VRRLLTTLLTATGIGISTQLKQSLIATASLINHWPKHELPYVQESRRKIGTISLQRSVYRR
jgi:hypothetical protein